MGTAYTSVSDGYWSNEYTWDPHTGIPDLSAGDTVTVNHAIVIAGTELYNLESVMFGEGGALNYAEGAVIITGKNNVLSSVTGAYEQPPLSGVSSLAFFGVSGQTGGELPANLIMDAMMGTLDPANVLDSAGGTLDSDAVNVSAGGLLDPGYIWEGNEHCPGTRVDCPAADALLGTEYGDPANPIVGELVQAEAGRPSILVV